MAYRLSTRSIARLDGVHPSLAAVVHLAIRVSTVDFTVVQGVRSLDEQRRLVASGASQTLNSRHLTGHAVDLAAWVDGAVSWHGPLYPQIADAMKKSAAFLGVPIEWGGDWAKFYDGPHFQLPFSQYPKE